MAAMQIQREQVWSWWPRGLTLAPVLGQRRFGPLLAAGLALLLALVQGLGEPRVWLSWLDIGAEGGSTLMLGVWLVQLRASRPAGRVTDLLCLGLAGLLLGAWMDLLDECWKLPRAPHWLHGLESAFGLAGMTLLTWGLHEWRQEQLALNEQLRRRERLFREHRTLDAATKLGDARYMAAQLRQERAAGRVGQLLMLGWEGFEQVARRHGLAEAERLLHAAAQLLLLNLRPDDLLCRYGADRFVVLLPECSAELGARMADELQHSLAALSHATADGQARYRLPVRMATLRSDGAADPEAQLLQLLERLRP